MEDIPSVDSNKQEINSVTYQKLIILFSSNEGLEYVPECIRSLDQEFGPRVLCGHRTKHEDGKFELTGIPENFRLRCGTNLPIADMVILGVSEVEGKPNEPEIRLLRAIEKKTYSDLMNCLGSQHEHFQRQIRDLSELRQTVAVDLLFAWVPPQNVLRVECERLHSLITKQLSLIEEHGINVINVYTEMLIPYHMNGLARWYLEGHFRKSAKKRSGTLDYEMLETMKRHKIENPKDALTAWMGCVHGIGEAAASAVGSAYSKIEELIEAGRERGPGFLADLELPNSGRSLGKVNSQRIYACLFGDELIEHDTLKRIKPKESSKRTTTGKSEGPGSKKRKITKKQNSYSTELINTSPKITDAQDSDDEFMIRVAKDS